MEEAETVDDFYGVYLLYSINPKYKGRTYIGYTRDPNRRVAQHNRGTWAGGAHRTNNKGPWKMVLIIHGFPNNISALRFEWAWQNPDKTIRLEHLNLKRVPRKESEFQFKLRILIEMLNVGPWMRLPLIVRWLEEEFIQDFQCDKSLPSHIKLCTGPIQSNNLKKHCNSGYILSNITCILCSCSIVHRKSLIKCLNDHCNMTAHISCIADRFLMPNQYVPIEGKCPICNINLLWGDLIRKMNGCVDQVLGEV